MAELDLNIIKKSNFNNFNLNVSVIICTKNRQTDLINCIKSLISQTFPLKEIIIIDSGDIDLYDIIKSDTVNNNIHLKYIRYKSGLTAARNRGIKESKGDIIIFLDDDVILYKDYIYYIVEIFKTNGKDIGGASGNIVSDEKDSKAFPKMIKYSSYKKIRYLIFNMLFLTSWGDGKFRPSGFPTHPIGKNNIMYIECLQGANMAFRKEVLEEFKFDENLQGYCFMEDCDISYRISRKYKIVYTPSAKLIHNISKVSRESDNIRMKMFLENHYYLFNKNIPKNAYNKFAFWVSIFGLFLRSLMTMNKNEFKGLSKGIEFINKNKKENGKIISK